MDQIIEVLEQARTFFGGLFDSASGFIKGLAGLSDAVESSSKK